jgi:anti-sigma B factor antagonist
LLSGRITLDSAPDLRLLLFERLNDRNCQELSVDLFDIVYIDASGLAILIEALRAARAQGKKLRLNRLREQPRNLLEAMHLLPLFEENRAEVPEESHAIEVTR